MTKVKVEPGVCGLTAIITAQLNDDDECDITVDSKCPTVNKMIEELGTTFDGMEVCMTRPGSNVFYEYAKKNYIQHGACPVISGIIKCIEAESQLALKKDAGIFFLE